MAELHLKTDNDNDDDDNQEEEEEGADDNGNRPYITCTFVLNAY
jgi:hypothetical protein